MKPQDELGIKIMKVGGKIFATAVALAVLVIAIPLIGLIGYGLLEISKGM